MSAATKAIIEEWFDRGVREKEEFMIVVCDTYDHDDYPVYTSKKNYAKEYAEHNGENMQRIMEVYNLKMSKKKQMAERRAFNGPK